MLYISMFHLDAVAIGAALFSAISIIVTALTVITQMMIRRKQSFMMIQFKVNGIGLKKTMTRKVRGIAAGIASILGVHRSAIEIGRAQDLGVGGFQFVIEMDVNADHKVDYQGMMQKAINRGAFAEMFKECWKLQKVPVFSGLHCQMMSTTSELQMVDKVQPKGHLQSGNPSTTANVVN